MVMNYHKYYPVDVVNGPGTRCSLFVSGCIHKCKGCYNSSTWKPDSGELYTQDVEDRIIADLSSAKLPLRGVSLSGGDPLYPGNLAAILKLLKRIRAECPGKDVWAWTGYLLEELTAEQQEVVALFDVLIDGKFVEELKDPRLVWYGSTNQRVHYLHENRQDDKPLLRDQMALIDDRIKVV